MKNQKLLFTAILLAFACLAFPSLVQAVTPAAGKRGASYKLTPQNRALSFADRIAYQYAIEEVFWRHRIWPKENSGSKPLLDEVMTPAQIERKVEDYLRDSHLLEEQWQRPISSEQLQAEMQRMAQHSTQPEVLRELFVALGNDPFVIAECLARPALSERLVSELYSHDKSSGQVKRQAEPDLRTHRRAKAGTETPVDLSAYYTLPQLATPSSTSTDDSWTPTTTANAPSARRLHTAVWTGSEMLVWGGFDGTYLNNLGRYTPSTDSWVLVSGGSAPAARSSHTAIWTGTEMIVWGGLDSSSHFNTGGRYNPTTNSWLATSTTNAPAARGNHTAVWTGNEMIVWGGDAGGVNVLNSGARYNPSTNSWTATSTTNVPSARNGHIAVWTGSAMIVWGGFNGGYLNTGGRYNPGTNSWTVTATTNAPSGRNTHTGVWTGDEMLVWGGYDGTNGLNTGGRYNPSTNSWVATSTTNAPSGRSSHKAVWAGNEMIVWGGLVAGPTYFNTGGGYNPRTNSWSATSITNAPSGRYLHSTVWTGNEMIVWGGFNADGNLNSGGRYHVQLTLGNYPETSMPLGNDTTVMPDAAPTNTARINVFTSTNFKGQLEANLGTGAVRITNAHPAGTYAVTVRAFDGAGAEMTRTFMLTVTTPATCNPLNFVATDFATGTNPTSVAVGDFNGDGKQDLATLNLNSDNVSILLGNGAGSFGAAVNFAAGGGDSVAVGDFNGDGKQDLAVTDRTLDGVLILLGDGAGNFSGPTNFAAGLQPYSVAVGDFNGDGKQDLAVANANSDNVSILLGNGAGTFSAAVNFPVGDTPPSVAVGDFNGDGKQDLAVANALSNNVSILLGNGAGNFGAAINFGAGIFPVSVAVGDFNGDGRQDLGVADLGSESDPGGVSILLGNGVGGFGAATNLGVGVNPYSIAVGDFNGDGKQDLTVVNYTSNNVSVLLGDGMGQFSGPINFAAVTNPEAVAVGDFNGDGKQDLAVADNTSNMVSVLLRDCAFTPSSAVSRKTHGAAGNFDVNLPLSGTTGVECRGGGATNDFTMVVTFAGDVFVTGSPQAEVTMGTGTIGSGGISNGGMVSVAGNVVTVPLTNIADQQTINVTLNGVNTASGTADVVIPMSRLLGDTNGNRAVNATDVSQTKLQSGNALTASNFRADVNTNGVINASDVSAVKLKSGTALP